MKIVIVSDTHGSRKNIENVCECNPDADMLIHLGDVEDDEDYIEAIFECPTHIVGGNNDFFSRLPREEEFNLEGHHIFITHGHAYYVSMGEAHLQEEARRRGADIVMYGHTHRPKFTFDDHLIVINPGSLTRPRQDGGLPSYIMLEMNKTNELSASIRYLDGANLYPEHFYGQEIQLPLTF